MKNLPHRKISIRKRTRRFVFITVILQGIIFLTVFFASGGMGKIEKSEANNFDVIVAEKSRQLENAMVHNWSNLGGSTARVNEIVREELDKGGYSPEALENNIQLNNRILERSAAAAAETIRSNAVNEVFIILNGYGAAENSVNRRGLLIRDLDPAVNRGYDDLLLMTGPQSICSELGITMGGHWSTRFRLGGGDSDAAYYWEPFRAAQEHPDYSADALGCWSRVFCWENGDLPVLAYSVPLIVDGTVYGVMGTTVTVPYLEEYLDYHGLDEGKGSYVLATTDKHREEYAPVSVSGIQTRDMDEDVQLVFRSQDRKNGLYKEAEGGLYGSIHSLSLYTKASPFYKTKWALLGIEKEKNLFDASGQMGYLMVFSFIISLLLGAFGAFFVSDLITKPIMALAKKIRAKDGRDNLMISDTGIDEIDELGNAIAVLNESVKDNASRLSRIIELVGLPVGAMEYSPKLDDVLCTGNIVRLLPVCQGQSHNEFLDRRRFEEFMEKNGLADLLAADGEKEHCVEAGEDRRWLSFKSMTDKNRTLITVLDITREVEEKQRIEYERDYDVLTKLLNRQAFRNRTEKLLAGKECRTGAMVMWDLDNLKYINDRYGHEYGDQYIQKAGNIFGNLLGENAVVGRISGDEFLAFIPEYADKSAVLHMMAKIKDHLNSTNLQVPDGDKVVLRASAGIAWYPDNGTTFEQLKKNADFAMYDTKNSFKGAFKEFDKVTYERDSLVFYGKEQLNKLIEQKAVRYVFQPIVSAVSGEVMGYEALMRPTIEGLGSPSDIMRIARNQGKMQALEILTFTQSLAAYKRQSRGRGKKRLFINSIPSQVLPGQLIQELFEEYREEMQCLVVEILESERIYGDYLETKRKLLRSVGVKIAIDDFGAGYSTESVLLYLNPDYVKIDMALVKNIHRDTDKQTIVKNLVRYTKPKGVITIAEGVENGEDMKTLIRLGVDYLQGFYLARPESMLQDIPAQRKEEIVRENRS